METEQWLPPGIDPERPSAARVYDYMLGGAHNFASDRRVGDQLLSVFPEARQVMQMNRAFLRRAVEYLTSVGIRQFLDIGSGLPTVGNVHEIAQAAAPDARVAYIDIDPIAVTHSSHVLVANDRTVVIEEDVRRPDAIIRHPDVQRLFDFSQPMAVMVVALFHFLPADEDLVDIIARLMNPLASGSHLVISHGTQEATDVGTRVIEVYRRAGMDLVSRTREQVAALFTGLELIAPGVVWVPQWRPDSPDDVGDRPEASANYAGVARKPLTSGS